MTYSKNLFVPWRHCLVGVDLCIFFFSHAVVLATELLGWYWRLVWVTLMS